MGKTGNWTSSEVQPLYTTGGNVKQTPRFQSVNSLKSKGTAMNVGSMVGTLSTAKYQGWSNDGIKQFNLLFGQIEAKRSSKFSNKFEEEFLVYCVNNQESSKKMKKKKNLVYKTCRHHLYSNSKVNISNTNSNESSDSEELDSNDEDEEDISNDGDDQSVGYNRQASRNV